MREIKFRTWNPKFNYFEYWGFYNDDTDNKPYFKGTPSGGGFVSNQILDNTEQFTGLRDKNGKEIYEGDIVRYKNKDESGTAKIEYLPGSFIFNWKDQNTLHPSIIDSAFYFGCSSELDVIGNIHEYPELMESK